MWVVVCVVCCVCFFDVCGIVCGLFVYCGVSGMVWSEDCGL